MPDYINILIRIETVFLSNTIFLEENQRGNLIIQ